MEKITHIAVGGVAGSVADASMGGAMGPYAAVLGGAIAVLPDLDLVIPFLTHRGVSHSLWTAILAGAVAWYAAGIQAGAVATAAILSHILIDLPNYTGVSVFWPLEPIGFKWFKSDGLAANAIMLLACSAYMVLVYGNVKVV